MPRTKSKSQQRSRANKSPSRTMDRKLATNRSHRMKTNKRTRELPLRGPNPVGMSQRNQAERNYGGDMSRRQDVARSKRQHSKSAQRRAGQAMPMGDTAEREAKIAGRRPKKVAASSGKPRSKTGRTPVRRGSKG